MALNRAGRIDVLANSCPFQPAHIPRDVPHRTAPPAACPAGTTRDHEGLFDHRTESLQLGRNAVLAALAAVRDYASEFQPVALWHKSCDDDQLASAGQATTLRPRTQHVFIEVKGQSVDIELIDGFPFNEEAAGLLTEQLEALPSPGDDADWSGAWSEALASLSTEVPMVSVRIHNPECPVHGCASDGPAEA